MMKYKQTDVNPANYSVGMWVWLLHRITGLVILGYAAAHLIVISLASAGNGGTFDNVMDTLGEPWVVGLEMVLLAAIFFHVLNGIRILLFDLGVGIRSQKQVFAGLMVVGCVLYAVAVWAILPAFSK